MLVDSGHSLRKVVFAETAVAGGLLHLGICHVCCSRIAHCVHLLQVPEIAFTGDTSGELMERDGNDDVWRAKLLIVECTFVDDSVTWEQVRGSSRLLSPKQLVP